jgi:CDP-diacylglycerol--serine O-phosphatidyltransferase
MKLLKQIPNILTSLNLTCGFIAIIMAFQPNMLNYAPYFIFIAAVFDFSDGFAARTLKAYSELGKQLDSMADMVSFGVAPGIIAYQMVLVAFAPYTNMNYLVWILSMIIPAFIPVFSALRLAKFNIDERQTSSFIGLPTPASAILISSIALTLFSTSNLFLIGIITNPFILSAIILATCYLMIAELPMFSLKMKSLSIKENSTQYIFLGLSLILIVAFQLYALPLIITLFILQSIIIYIFRKA